jgi:hypothetical protein
VTSSNLVYPFSGPSYSLTRQFRPLSLLSRAPIWKGTLHNVAFALIYYLEAYDGILGMFFRDEDPQNMEEAQDAAIKVERIFLAVNKFPLIHVPDQPVR